MLLASTIQGIAQSAGLVDTGLDRASFLVQVNRCLRVVLDPITLPSPLNIGTSKSLDARAQAVFSGTPNPQSVPFSFTVTATGASVQNPEGFSDAEGRYTTVFTPSASAPRFTVKACLADVADICVSQDVAENPTKFLLTSFVGMQGPVAPPCGVQSDITFTSVSLPFSSALPVCLQATNSISATRIVGPEMTTITVSGTVGVNADNLRGEVSAQVNGTFITEIDIAQTSVLTVSVPAVLPTVTPERLSATVLNNVEARWAISVRGLGISGGLFAGASAGRLGLDSITTTLTTTESATVPPGKYFLEVGTSASCQSFRTGCSASGGGEFGRLTIVPAQ